MYYFSKLFPSISSAFFLCIFHDIVFINLLQLWYRKAVCLCSPITLTAIPLVLFSWGGKLGLVNSNFVRRENWMDSSQSVNNFKNCIGGMVGRYFLANIAKLKEISQLLLKRDLGNLVWGKS